MMPPIQISSIIFISFLSVMLRLMSVMTNWFFVNHLSHPSIKHASFVLSICQKFRLARTGQLLICWRFLRDVYLEGKDLTRRTFGRDNLMRMGYNKGLCCMCCPSWVSNFLYPLSYRNSFLIEQIWTGLGPTEGATQAK